MLHPFQGWCLSCDICGLHRHWKLGFGRYFEALGVYHGHMNSHEKA